MRRDGFVHDVHILLVVFIKNKKTEQLDDKDGCRSEAVIMSVYVKSLSHERNFLQC